MDNQENGHSELVDAILMHLNVKSPDMKKYPPGTGINRTKYAEIILKKELPNNKEKS